MAHHEQLTVMALLATDLRRWAVAAAGAAALLYACGGGGSDPQPPANDAPDAEDAADAGDTVADQAVTPDPVESLLAIPVSQTWSLPGLTGDVHVVRTEMGVPHLYASSREDLGRVLGFVLGQDRFFVMDLQRRLGLGTISGLLGDAALENDQESRGLGMAYVADRLLQNMSPEMESYLDAFAAGLNAYIVEVAAGNLPAPSEIELTYGILGAPTPAALMHGWDRRDVAGMVAVVMYETTFEGGDVGRTAKRAALATLFEGDGPMHALRRNGFLDDVAGDLRPLFPDSSATGPGVDREGTFEAGPLPQQNMGAGMASEPSQAHTPSALIHRLAERLERFSHRIQRNAVAGFGSNAWAVAGSASTDGSALIAGDGHLQLSMPPLMYQIGLDTALLGGQDIHQAGLLMTGLPMLAVGTNGRVAWSQVNPVIDITDWYAEVLQLDGDGAPATSLQGDFWLDLVAVEEAYEIADVPALGSTGRTESWTRWTTFDGRWIAEIEGRDAGADEQVAEGETLINLQGRYRVPGDMDGDGFVSAISFDYAAFDATSYIDALDQLGRVDDVHGFREATRGIVGSGLFSAVGDANGDILYTSYQAIPCRTYLPRDAEGGWLPGADPTVLLNGSLYRGFHLPMKDGQIDPEPGVDDPYECAVPFDAMPQSINPTSGYVATANNDPGNFTADGSLTNDAWYIGGPWSSVRVNTIGRDLQRHISESAADGDAMAATQANNDSRLGELFAPHFVEAIQTARALSQTDGDQSVDEERLVAFYDADPSGFDEAADRLTAWGAAGYRTPSGVETFYHAPTDADRDAAVATMIFNATLGRFIASVWNDEPLGDVWVFSSSRMKVRALRRFLEGRGSGNPDILASWNPDTGESVFFDIYDTPEVERSRELLLASLASGLAFLRAEPTGAGAGGFGTDHMAAWLWGLRHQARFEALLGSFLGDDPTFGFLGELFSLTTETLPLASGIAQGDPRYGLKWFPRGGDQWSVDAGNPGFGATSFTHGSGPVMRMVIGLKDGKVEGRNILPGGQSGLRESPHFADQAALWLANDTVPLRFHLDEVVAGAVGREVYVPAP